MVEHFSPGPLAPGIIIKDRYEIINLIKTGGMGAVYRALDRLLDRICALKELIPPYGTPEEQIKSAEWFMREGKLLARLDHPSLPKVFDYFLLKDRYYLVMTFIEGEDLESKLKREGNPGLPEKKVTEWARQILNILDYLHKETPPVIYRDIKPANIMINQYGRVMLIDFGIAR